jgi:Ca-activated chloride channel family protein
MKLQFAYPWILVWVGLLTIAVLWWRWRKRAVLEYRYPLIGVVAASLSWRDILIAYGPRVLYSVAALVLVIALARPRIPDERTQIDVEGIGIMLVLDVSQSMLCFDDPRNQVSRFASAQEEAINFISRRPHDLFGLVLFGRVAATRCPLTLDHGMLTSLIRNTEIGVIPDDETALAQGIIMGLRRLQKSRSKNNIMVVLTDGEPSPGDEQLLPEAIALAQKSSVKIYTIGIGSPGGGYFRHPLMGIVNASSFLRPDILKTIAYKTGGAYFEAQNQKELSEIYTNIDTLETSVQKEPIYAQWHEYYVPLVVVALCLLVIAWGICAWWVIL